MTLGLCFTVKELVDCSLTGQRKNIKENKDPRPGLDDNKRIFLEGMLLVQSEKNMSLIIMHWYN